SRRIQQSEIAGRWPRWPGWAGRPLETDLRLLGIGERLLPLLALIPNDESRAMRTAELGCGGDPAEVGRNQNPRGRWSSGPRRSPSARGGTVESRRPRGPPTGAARPRPAAPVRSTARRTAAG